MERDLKAYRRSQGMSQWNLAQQLHVSKSTISMVESGDRKLPKEARAIFDGLLAKEKKTGDAPPAESSVTFAEVQQFNISRGRSALLDHQKKCELELLRLEVKLDKLRTRYQLSLADFLIAQDYLAKMAAGKTKEAIKYPSKKELQYRKALDNLLRIGDQQPAVIMVKIAGLQQELKTIAQLLKKPGAPPEEPYAGLPFDEIT